MVSMASVGVTPGWFGTGATAGFGGAMWLRRRVLRTVQRYAPERVQADVSTSVRRLGTDLRAAVTEETAIVVAKFANSDLGPHVTTRLTGTYGTADLC